MSDKDYTGLSGGPDGQTDVNSGQQPDGGSTAGGQDGQGTGDGGSTSGSTSIACSRTTGHDVWYYDTDMTLTYTCDEAVTSVASTTKPSFLTAATSGSTVTFTGTTPTSTSDTDWSFTVNGESTTGDAASINTTVLNPSTITLSIETSPNVAGGNDAVIALDHTATLASAWDGDMTDVSFSSVNLDTDMHGITLQASCDTATPPYVCDGTESRSAKTIDSDTDLRWNYSAFDQGSYYYTLQADITIEGKTHSLSGQTGYFSIGEQSAGDISMSFQPDVSTGTLRNVQYNYDVAVSSDSTATAPQVGVLYFSQDSSTADSQFRRLAVDRTDDPSGGGNGVTESTNLQVSGGVISYAGAVRSLVHTDTDYDGDWIVAGVRLDGTGQNVYVARVPNTATPAVEADDDLTNFNTTSNDAKYLDMTESFSDGGTIRHGIAYVRSDGVNDILTVAKINPTGTDKSSFVDDARYDTDPAGNQFEISGTLGKIDRVKIRYVNESGGMFYVAYRDTTDLKVTKLATQWSAGPNYNDTTTSAPFTSVFADADGTNFQSLDMAVASVGGSTIVGLVYRDSSGDCFFRRLNEALTTASTAVQLSTDTCWFPSLHYNSKSGQFVATWGEENTSNSNQREIYSSRISLSTTDTASTPLRVLDTGFSDRDFQQIDTDYYPDGDWISIIYRMKFTDDVKFHAYHIIGQ